LKFKRQKKEKRQKNYKFCHKYNLKPTAKIKTNNLIYNDLYSETICCCSFR